MICKRMGRQSLLPRFVHRFWAWLNGYFWLPCPICGRPFGGHEDSSVSLWTGPNTGLAICRDPACARQAVRLNSESILADERRRSDICDVLNVLLYKVPKVCEGTIDENALWWWAELVDKNLGRGIVWSAVEGRFYPRPSEATEITVEVILNTKGTKGHEENRND